MNLSKQKNTDKKKYLREKTSLPAGHWQPGTHSRGAVQEDGWTLYRLAQVRVQRGMQSVWTMSLAHLKANRFINDGIISSHQ